MRCLDFFLTIHGGLLDEHVPHIVVWEAMRGSNTGSCVSIGYYRDDRRSGIQGIIGRVHFIGVLFDKYGCVRVPRDIMSRSEITKNHCEIGDDLR